MDDKEFRAIKARIMYQEYIAHLPKCDKCDKCLFVNDRDSVKRICTAKREVVDSRIKTCPRWCPKRL